MRGIAAAVATVRKARAGTAGDRAETSSGVWINGVLWPWSAPQSHDWSGKKLAWRARSYQVGPGTMLLMGLQSGRV